jgi:amidase
MARTVSDVALLLSVLAGSDARTPLSIPEGGSRFASRLDRNVKGARIAWWRDLGGIPVEAEVKVVVDANRAVFEQLGCVIEEAEPDFSGVDDAFPTLRHLSYHANYAPLARQRPEWVKDTIRWEIAEAERQTGADVGRALARQGKMFEQTRAFFERYDYFVLPVTQMEPFNIDLAYPTTINDTPMRDYIDWMRSCWYVTFMASPAISVPAGFTSSGLPVGLQIVGRHRDEWSVLRLAYAFEGATKHGERRPPM